MLMRFVSRKEREREREREREHGVSRKEIPVPHPSPRPAGPQDPDCRPVPTHVILTRTMIPGLYTGNSCDSTHVILTRTMIPGLYTGNSCDSIVSVYIPFIFHGPLHSSRTAHFRVSLSTYPDYPAPHVSRGFGLRYWRGPIALIRIN